MGTRLFAQSGGNASFVEGIPLNPYHRCWDNCHQEKITPGSVFNKVGIDYAGPVLIRYGYVRKPTIVKAYICVFVSLSVKAVHLVLVTDLTADAFIASLRRFIARRSLRTLIWSDNGTNFVGASRQLMEVYNFLKTKVNHKALFVLISLGET